MSSYVNKTSVVFKKVGNMLWIKGWSFQGDIPLLYKVSLKPVILILLFLRRFLCFLSFGVFLACFSRSLCLWVLPFAVPL